jgi:6-phosphogluconolactonase/glucosamine-6-phosphate isomerase/deaminase
VAGYVEVRVLEDAAAAAAVLLAAAAADQGHVALSGGSTVGTAYELAAGLQRRWTGVHVWFGDERAVPPDDERSNYRLVHTTLLDALDAPPEVHRIRGESSAEDAARLYHTALEGVTLDLALNGIGSDGHTASLFPGSPALEERERRAGRGGAGSRAVRPAGHDDATRLRLGEAGRLPRHGRGEGGGGAPHVR